MVDTVADTLIRIKNGYLARKVDVEINFSKLNLNLCKLLEQQGYLADIKQEKTGILVSLKYQGKEPALTDVKRVSKPGLRVYKKVGSLPRVLDGLGIAIVSTPKGLMTDKEARKQRLGGEVLALVW